MKRSYDLNVIFHFSFLYADFQEKRAKSTSPSGLALPRPEFSSLSQNWSTNFKSVSLVNLHETVTNCNAARSRAATLRTPRGGSDDLAP
jgi:hypothetical protein